jgi:predicted ATP-grasp superfamily ATP-dependent carboligase
MNILIVDDVDNLSLLDVVRCLGQNKKITIYIASFQNKRRLHEVRFSVNIKKYFYLSQSTDQEKVEKLVTLANRLNIKTILPFRETTIKLFADFKEQFEDFNIPPVNSPHLIESVTNKMLLFELLERKSICTPPSYSVSIENFDKLKFPCLIKPRKASGGTDIFLLKNKKEALDKIKNPKIKNDCYIFQDYIEGQDIDISLIAENGKIIAHTIQTGITSYGFGYSRGIRFVKNPEFLHQVEILIQKLNWNGLAHLDFVYDKITGSYQLIDFNPRSWSTILGSLKAGINFPQILLNLTEGKKVTVASYKEIHYLQAGNSWKLFISALIKKNNNYSLNNSSIYYAVKDPFAEIIKLLQVIWTFLKESNKRPS